MRKILLFLLMLLPMVANAHDFYVNGIYYLKNGTEATVTYRGTSVTMNNNSYSGSVTIPETVSYNGTTYTVTAIGDYAFFYNKVTSVIIPNTVTSIGMEAFYYCNKLTDITIPNSVYSIGDQAFRGTLWYNNQPDGLVYAGLVVYDYKGNTPSGANITLRDGTIGIADYALAYWSGLTGITIPNSVINIGDGAFSHCTGLTSITIPNSVSKIGHAVFFYCSGLTNVTIPSSVTSIGSVAFNGCTGLTSITIPNSIISIDVGAFSGCSSLANVNIPNSVTTIGNSAFSGCSSLVSVNIPDSVTSIGNGAFSGCNGLTNITVESGNPYFDSRNNCNAIIETATNKLICGCHNTIIPNSITTIGVTAYKGCATLKDIIIPNSVTSIEQGAFMDCSGLTSISIPNSVTSIETNAFYGCSRLACIIIPNSVNTIGGDVFKNCDNLSACFLTGAGDWTAGDLNNAAKTLYIDAAITSVQGIKEKALDIFCFAETPPTSDENSFTDYSATLHVPAASLANYFIAPYWCNFANIVGDAVFLTELAIQEDSLNVSIGDEIQLNTVVLPVNASSNIITWISSEPSVATVENGKVTAIAYGECDIIAMCLNHRSVCHVTVSCGNIILDHHEIQVLPNHIVEIIPTTLDADLPELTVSSSDPSVAAARLVNNKIQVVGIKEGTTTITVGSVDGTAIPATCLVTVYTEPGDMNCDGFLNISDVTSLIDYLLSGENSQISTKNADVNGDENINISDVTTLIDILLSGNG